MPRAFEVFSTFSFCLIDASACSILCVMRRLKNLILEAKVVVMYSNCHIELGCTLHEQTVLTRHLHMETGGERRREVLCKANLTMNFFNQLYLNSCDHNDENYRQKCYEFSPAKQTLLERG